MNERSTPQKAQSVRRPTRARMWCIALLMAYVTTYVLLSRRGYAEAERYDFEGFYYFTPEESNVWRCKNYGCVVLFYPLNLVDRGLGLGRVPASDPLWRLGA